MRMRFAAVVLIGFCTLFADPALAREGFYLGFGGGYTSSEGQDVPYDAFEVNEFNESVPRMISVSGEFKEFSTALESGSGAIFRMGFNVRGYGAIEAMMTGLGEDLTDADLRQWAAHAHAGIRLYPAWHWQDLLPEELRPLEPSLFFGWGTTYQVYVPEPSIKQLREVGWSTSSSFRFGMGLEYFILSYFKVGLDYFFIDAPFDTFIFNFADSDNFPVDPEVAGKTYHQFFMTMNFQFGPAPEMDYSNAGVDL